ncbi:MAG: fused response regulator/phosphatase [Bacteroidales bacterium]|nr:fused response regulator/phosphatase [Bacteroidales bacterium]
MNLSQPNILIVDDDVLICRVVEVLLKGINANVSIATNGEEAISIAREKIFDCIISDLQMPLMNGNELIRKLRYMPEYKFTPFIFLSSNNEEETWIKNINDGADDFITKPFNGEVLIAKIKANLKKASLRKESIRLNQDQNISFDRGKICYCFSGKDKFEIPTQKLCNELIPIENEEVLFRAINEENIWLILIDDHADWAIQIVQKILVQAINNSIPVQFLAGLPLAEVISKNIIDLDYGGVIPKSLAMDILVCQINNLLNREIELKDKYLSALSSAASNTPIKFDHNLDRELLDFKLSFFHEPFEKIPGGDFYEFFSLGNNLEIIVLGDVMGKKWRAWFFSLAYIAYIRSTINFFIYNQDFHINLNPEYLLEVLNKYIYKDLQLAEVFTTLSIVLVDPNTSTLRIASAGALRPLFLHGDSGKIKRLNIVGTLLGVLEDTKYKCLKMKMEPGDRVLLFTDGYPETAGADGNMVGEEAMEECFRSQIQSRTLTCQQIEQCLTKKYSISSFDDDRTMLLISRDATAPFA